jgi:hypothetical protein
VATSVQNHFMISQRFREAAQRSWLLSVGVLPSAASVSVLLVGCAPYWGASGGTFVEYSGADTGKVETCADFSTHPEHRSTSKVPLYAVVGDIDVVSPIEGTWEVSGTTKFVIDDGDEYLAWSCEVVIDPDTRTMHAALVDTGPGAEFPLCGATCSAPSAESIKIDSESLPGYATSLACLDLVAAIAAPTEQTGRIKATMKGDHDAPTRRFHGTLKPGPLATYQWTCELNRAHDPWALDYELTLLEPS